MSGRRGWGAAFLPGAPVLVPELTGPTGRADLLALREACAAALHRVLRDRPAAVVCVGVGTATVRHDPGAWGTVAGFGAAATGAGRDDGAPATLPLSLTVARLQLAAAGWTGPVVQQELDAGATLPECAQVLAQLPVAGTAWLVPADGSTCRTLRAPGGFDPRGGDFDAGVERALRGGRPDLLRETDPQLAVQLGATGWAPWTALALAAQRAVAGDPADPGDPGDPAAQRAEAHLDYADAPLGVGYLVGTWRVPAGPATHP